MKKTRLRLKTGALIALLVIAGLLCIATSITYMYLASPVDKKDDKVVEVKIKEGMSTVNIAGLLKNKGVIKSKTFFIVYYKLNKCSYLKASNYDLKKSMSLNTIFDKICKGDYSKDVVTITFKEGERLTEYAKLISNKTNNNEEEVLNILQDKEYLNELIDKYWFLTDEILDDNIYYALEGYLYPDTYKFKNKDVRVEEIVEDMLDQTDKVYSKYKDKLQNKKHTIHEYVTLASMAELEGTNTENRKMIVGIFENRLKLNMNLGSDVTTYYGLQRDMKSDLTSEEFNTSNAYNTRNKNMKGIPVGPICSVSSSALDAATSPTESNNFFFVADKYGNIYYTPNAAEHEKKVKELKESGAWIW